jgi:hypothetical protein
VITKQLLKIWQRRDHNNLPTPSLASAEGAEINWKNNWPYNKRMQLTIFLSPFLNAQKGRQPCGTKLQLMRALYAPRVHSGDIVYKTLRTSFTLFRA